LHVVMRTGPRVKPPSLGRWATRFTVPQDWKPKDGRLDEGQYWTAVELAGDACCADNATDESVAALMRAMRARGLADGCNA